MVENKHFFFSKKWHTMSKRLAVKQLQTKITVLFEQKQPKLLANEKNGQKKSWMLCFQLIKSFVAKAASFDFAQSKIWKMLLIIWNPCQFAPSFVQWVPSNTKFRMFMSPTSISYYWDFHLKIYPYFEMDTSIDRSLCLSGSVSFIYD